MNYFLISDISSHKAQLNADEARHCIQVLRHKIGDIIHGIDGAGNGYRAEIIEIEKKSVSLRVLETLPNWGESPNKTGLILAPMKQRERLEWLVEKGVELGITHLWLAETARTKRDRTNTDRLNRIMLEALKQCKRSRLPILKAAPFADCLKEADALGFENRWLAYCEATAPLNLNAQKGHNAVFAIGPEGDFTSEEVSLAEKFGFQTVSLGYTRLRTETAALATLAGWKMGVL